MTDTYGKSGDGLYLLTLLEGTYYAASELIICSTRGAESWWEVSEGEQCQTLNFLEERSIQDSLCVHWSIIPKMHTWARGGYVISVGLRHWSA